MKKISVVLPCHNEESNLPVLIPEIIKNIPRRYSYEIICVDDGSTDNTRSAITLLSRRNKKIKGIVFYKNFGHQEALRAGIERSTGDAIITMDADFQQPPKVIADFIKYWQTGSDLVIAKKSEDKNQSLFMKIQRILGYKIWKGVTHGLIPPGVSDFRLMSKKVKDYVLGSKETEIFLRGVVSLAAKNIKIISYKVGKRKYGRSSYTMKMFVDMFAKGFISFSTMPLRIATFSGLFLLLTITVFVIIDILTAVSTGRRIIEGYKTLAILVIGINGILMLYLGILGEYVGTIFKEVKKRPTYHIEALINIKK